MCDKCNNGYVLEQRESTLYGGKPIIYEVLVECECKKVKKVDTAEKSKIIKNSKTHEWWQD